MAEHETIRLGARHGITPSEPSPSLFYEDLDFPRLASTSRNLPHLSNRALLLRYLNLHKKVDNRFALNITLPQITFRSDQERHEVERFNKHPNIEALRKTLLQEASAVLSSEFPGWWIDAKDQCLLLENGEGKAPYPFHHPDEWAQKELLALTQIVYLFDRLIENLVSDFIRTAHADWLLSEQAEKQPVEAETGLPTLMAAYARENGINEGAGESGLLAAVVIEHLKFEPERVWEFVRVLCRLVPEIESP